MRILLTVLLTQFFLLSHAKTINLFNIHGYSHDGKLLKKLDSLLFDTETGLILERTPENLASAESVDGKGKLILPGLHDAHGHILEYGLAQLLVNIQES